MAKWSDDQNQNACSALLSELGFPLVACLSSALVLSLDGLYSQRYLGWQVAP